MNTHDGTTEPMTVEQILATVRNAENRAAQEIQMGNEGWLKNQRRYADTIVTNAERAINSLITAARVDELRLTSESMDLAFLDGYIQERIAQLTKENT